MKINHIVDHMYDEYEGAKGYFMLAKEEEDKTKMMELKNLALEELSHYEIFDKYFNDFLKKDEHLGDSEAIHAFYNRLYKKVIKLKNEISLLK